MGCKSNFLCIVAMINIDGSFIEDILSSLLLSALTEEEAFIFSPFEDHFSTFFTLNYRVLSGQPSRRGHWQGVQGDHD